MKLKFNSAYDEKRKKGYEVEIDKIKYEPTWGGGYKVRVVGEWSKPTYLALSWFCEHPDSESPYRVGTNLGV